jgi:hypothetical protein
VQQEIDDQGNEVGEPELEAPAGRVGHEVAERREQRRREGVNEFFEGVALARPRGARAGSRG